MAATNTRVIRLVLLAAALVAGWLFILSQNRFYLTPAVVFVMLAYFAVVMTTYNLWRTGVAAVAINEEDDGDESWGRPIGEREELEKEKRTLVKAIKEAEFDHEMGKLSKRDVDEMIASYRARAIDVIKEIERLDAGEAGTVKERIEREVKARLELAGKVEAKGQAAKKAKKAKPDDAKADDAKPDDAKPDAANADAAKPVDAKPDTEPAAEPAVASAVELDARDADTRDAKEATP